MDRKEFLKRSAGMCCGAAVLLHPVSLESGRQKAPEPPVSPCDKKVKQGQAVIRRIMRQLDEKVDRTTRESIMESCGRVCYEGAHGKRAGEKPDSAQVERFLNGMRKYLGPEGVKQAGDEILIYFKYTGNPHGLKTSDGYCLCPILEDAPKDISPTYCHCSIGYVKEIFERNVGKPARVEITETVLRGGQTCRFTVSFKS